MLLPFPALLGLGAVLVQHIEGQEKVIAYASRTLTSAERNFSVTERECLGVLFAVEKFRPYVEGSHFKVITDHSSLKWLRSLKNPTGRLCRWIFRLDQFDFETIHRKGKLMAVADCLSRAPYNNVSGDSETEGVEMAVVDMVPPPDIQQTNDPWYLQLKDKITANPSGYPSFTLSNDKIYKMVTDRTTNRLERRLVIPTD